MKVETDQVWVPAEGPRKRAVPRLVLFVGPHPMWGHDWVQWTSGEGEASGMTLGSFRGWIRKHNATLEAPTDAR